MRRIAHTLLTSVAVAIVIFPMIGRAAAATPAQNAASTVVIYNLNNPESKGLADFYCSARSIDPSQEIGLTAPVTEEISRSDYDSNISTPLRQTMIQRGYWILGKDPHDHPLITASRMHYAVLMRGIPLKIQQCTNYKGDNTQVQQPPFGTCNAASVDSELSLLGLYNSQVSGVFENPLYVKTLGGTNTQSDSNPNLPVRTNAEASVPAPMLLVGRLDAPTADAVKAMILNGIKAEKEGLWGWGYIDLRSITDPGCLRHFSKAFPLPMPQSTLAGTLAQSMAPLVTRHFIFFREPWPCIFIPLAQALCMIHIQGGPAL